MSEVPAYGEERATARERRLIEFAWTRNRIVTAAELGALGFGPNAVARRVGKRALTWMHRGVYLLGPGPPSFTQRCAAAARAVEPRGAVGGMSAAHLAGVLRGRRPREIDVIVPGGHARRGLDVDASTLDEDEVELVDGIRTTKWPRTVIDATAQGADPQKLLVAVEKREGMLDVLALDRAFAKRPHKRGVKEVQEALRRHHPLAVRCRSNDEIAFLYALLAAGVPTFEVNGDASEYEVDFCWRRGRVIAEVDGSQHGLVHQQGVDQVRDHAHERNGLLVLRFPVRTVRADVAGAVRVTAQVLRARGRLS